MDITKFYTSFLLIEQNEDKTFKRNNEGKKNTDFITWGSWQKNQSLKTQNEVDNFFGNVKNAALALVTGKRNNITVIDFDTLDNEFMMMLAEYAPTLMVKTEKGFHFYYEYIDNPIFKNAGGVFGRQIDCRTEGGIIFCPPTPNYVEYNTEPISPITPQGLELLLEMAKGRSKKDISDTLTRNDSLYRHLCGRAEHSGLSREHLWQEAMDYNQSFVKGPMEESRVRTLFNSAMKFLPEIIIQKKIEEEIKDVKFISFTDVVGIGRKELESTDPKSVISFGYPWLDKRLTGIFPGELIVIGGESGTGKTTFATNIIYKASKNYRCTVFALEDRIHDYGIKALYFEVNRMSKEFGNNYYLWNDFRLNEFKGDKAHQELLDRAQQNLKNENVFFVDVNKQMDIDLLEVLIRKEVEKGTKLFLIDHLHYFNLSKDAKSSKTDYIETCMVRMKTLQKEIGASILLIVHYRKLDGKKPTMDSFKDSVSIAQNANYVINLWRDREKSDEQKKYETTFFIPKARNPNGEGMVVAVFSPENNDYVSEGNWRAGGSREPVVSNNATIQKALNESFGDKF